MYIMGNNAKYIAHKPSQTAKASNSRTFLGPERHYGPIIPHRGITINWNSI
jgi:hypothetical protein